MSDNNTLTWKHKLTPLVIIVVMIGIFILAGWLVVWGIQSSRSPAEKARDDIRSQAVEFEVFQRVVVFNEHTGDYIAEIRGVCHVLNLTDELRVVCLASSPEPLYDNYEPRHIRHTFYLSGSVSFYTEQLYDYPASELWDRYDYIHHPSEIVPFRELKLWSTP